MHWNPYRYFCTEICLFFGNKNLKHAFSILILVLALSACAGKMPVPGGSDAVNETCFNSIGEMEAHLAGLLPGMPESEVLPALCHKKEALVQLDRRELRIALLGGENIPFSTGQPVDEHDLIHSLYGYKLNFKNVKRKHGFSSPIRIRTDESGFNYCVTLIFKEGRLYEKPILSGGIVNNTKSGTLFDFITPGTILNRALP